MRTKARTRSVRPIIAKTVIYAIMVLLCISTVFPFYWTFMTSLMENEQIYKTPIDFFPPVSVLSFQNYAEAFSRGNLLVYLKNSVLVTGLNILLSLLTASMVAYAVTKIRFRGSKALYRVFLSSMMVPGFVTLVPTYLVIDRLGMMETLWSLIVPGALSVYGIFFLRSFLVGINDETGESAKIDGAGEYRIFFQIYLPQIRVGLIILAVTTFQASWNNYLGPQLYIKQNTDLLPLGAALKNITVAVGDMGVSMALSLLFALPVFVTFCFVQKYFLTGFAVAGIKG